MIRAKDAIVLAVLAWWLLRDTEETSVKIPGAMQDCMDANGNVLQVPVGEDCPPGYTFVNISPPYVPEAQMSGYFGKCTCGGTCPGCA